MSDRAATAPAGEQQPGRLESEIQNALAGTATGRSEQPSSSPSSFAKPAEGLGNSQQAGEIPLDWITTAILGGMFVRAARKLGVIP